MKIVYAKEEEYYNSNELEFFTENQEKLIKRKIIKRKRNLYKFNYVGIIIDGKIKKRIIIVLPKYLKNISIVRTEEKNYSKLLIQTFRKYAKDSLNNENLDNLDYLSENTHFNFIAIVDYLINDYIQYGLYNNNVESYEYNGNGLIAWEKTISEEYATILNNQIIYTNFITRAEENDENNYIQQIHQNIIYQCFEFLEEISFIDIFEYPSLYVTRAKTLIQDINHQLQSIDIEMRTIFSDRKIYLLKAMKYFLEKNSNLSTNDIVLYGTSSFYHVWETAISHAFNNQYEQFKKYIPNPLWRHIHPKSEPIAVQTLIPDTIRQIGNSLFIIDAKYYNPPFLDNGRLRKGSPGVEDIGKQFLYIQALKSKLPLPSFQYFNCFIMPTSSDDIINTGEVSFEIFDNIPNIKVILFPGKTLFKMYVKEEILTDVEIINILS